MPSDNTLARKVHALEQRLRQIERGQRVAHGASIENAAIEVRDAGGSLRAIVGQQGDGTTGVNVVNGPTPPTPSAPTVEPALAALAVTWNGQFADGAVAPLDWMRCEVHVGPTAGFTPDQGTLRDTIESPQGGTVVVPLPYTQWHVKLRSRTTSGVASAPTAAVAGTPRKAEAADIVAGAITANHIAVDALTGKTITGGTITGATIQTAASGARVVLDDRMRIYDAGNNLMAQAKPTDATNVAGFYVYNGDGYSAALTQGIVSFRLASATYQRYPYLEHRIAAGDVSDLLLRSGTTHSSGAQAVVKLTGGTSSIRPYVRIFSDALGSLDCDLEVTGVLTARSIATGTVTITPSAAHVPTQFQVTGLNVAGTTFRGFATANTTVPGVRTPTGNQGVTGVSVSNVSGTGLTVWVNRENTTATNINWMVIGS